MSLLLLSCASRVLSFEKQSDGSYWIAASGNSAENALKAGKTKAQETADQYKTSYKIIKKNTSSKVTVNPAHMETRWINQTMATVGPGGQTRTVQVRTPVSEWVPEQKFTTYYCEIWVKFDRPVSK